MRVAVFSLALALSLSVAFLAFRGDTAHGLAVLWFLSLFPFLLAADDRRPTSAPPAAKWLLPLLAALSPVLVRVTHIDLSRMHTDEFLTAYFSATHDFGNSSFFHLMPEKQEWVAQFAKPFFLSQRVFFDLFGASTLTLRLSIQVYVAIVSLMLFLIVHDLLGPKSALVAVYLYSFLAVSLYLETLGFMFISSTAVFMVFFYFALREYRMERMFDAALAGVACGFCYLTYYSSYLAFPVLLAFAALHFLRERKSLVLQNFVIALGGMLLVLAPFIAVAWRSGNSLTRRANQISLLTGEWSPHRQTIAKGASPLPVIKENLLLSLRSFIEDGVGGHGGYDFGHLPFFDRFSLALFLTGFLAGLILIFRKRELSLVYLVTGAAFLTGVVLTIPPPAYHRFSIAFPFLAILMTLPFSLLWRARKLPNSVRYAFAGGLLLLFACVNERQFTEAVFRDRPTYGLRLSELLNQRFAGRRVYVAAFPGFAFDKILYFSEKGRHRQTKTAYHAALLKNFNPTEKYVYVVIFPQVFRESFEKADPRGHFFPISPDCILFAN